MTSVDRHSAVLAGRCVVNPLSGVETYRVAKTVLHNKGAHNKGARIESLIGYKYFWLVLAFLSAKNS